MSDTSRPPTGEEIAAAIKHVHQARREAWPPPDELREADVQPLKMLALVAGWGKMRTDWMEKVEELIEGAPVISSVAELEQWEREFIAMLQQSANDFRLQLMASVLDDE